MLEVLQVRQKSVVQVKRRRFTWKYWFDIVYLISWDKKKTMPLRESVYIISPALFRGKSVVDGGTISMENY